MIKKLLKGDFVVAFYVLSAFIMLIVPIPSWLLDILLAVNMSVAFSILFSAMLSKEPLDMSFYPTPVTWFPPSVTSWAAAIWSWASSYLLFC